MVSLIATGKLRLNFYPYIYRQVIFITIIIIIIETAEFIKASTLQETSSKGSYLDDS
jgi:hypothetical protein